jgi:hypothetical protein
MWEQTSTRNESSTFNQIFNVGCHQYLACNRFAGIDHLPGVIGDANFILED